MVNDKAKRRYLNLHRLCGLGFFLFRFVFPSFTILSLRLLIYCRLCILQMLKNGSHRIWLENRVVNHRLQLTTFFQPERRYSHISQRTFVENEKRSSVYKLRLAPNTHTSLFLLLLLILNSAFSLEDFNTGSGRYSEREDRSYAFNFFRRLRFLCFSWL